MFRSVTLTVQPGTTPEIPASVEVELCAGTLQTVRIISPPGPNWECYAKVRYREFSLIPTQEDEWIPLENSREEIHPEFDGWDGTYVVTAELCAPGARYEHSITFDFDVLEKETTQEMLRKFIEAGF